MKFSLTMHTAIGGLVTYVLLLLSALVSAVAGAEYISEQEAVGAAMRYLGLNSETKSAEWTATEVEFTTATHENSAAVRADDIGGKAAWRVTLSNVVVRLSSTRPQRNTSNPMDLSVLVEAKTGRLLKVYSVGNPSRFPDGRFPWEKILESAGHPYASLSLSQDCPDIALLPAIEADCHFKRKKMMEVLPDDSTLGTGNPFLMKQIEAYPILSNVLTSSRQEEGSQDGVHAIWLLVGTDFNEPGSSDGSVGPAAIRKPRIVYQFIDPLEPQAGYFDIRTFSDPPSRVGRGSDRSSVPESVDSSR